MDAFDNEAKAAFQRELRRLIEQRNKTQNEFAAEAGLSPAMVSNWLNGKYMPSLEHLYILARATGTDVFKWVALLAAQPYSYENAVREKECRIHDLEVQLATLRARAG